MFYHFKYHKEKSSYWAEGVELTTCFSEADTLTELKENLVDALNLHLNQNHSSKIIFPMPKKKVEGKNIIKVKVEDKIAFAMLLRQARLKCEFSQNEMARKLGHKNVNGYQKLERASSNPTFQMMLKLRDILPSLRLDYIFGREKI